MSVWGKVWGGAWGQVWGGIEWFVVSPDQLTLTLELRRTLTWQFNVSRTLQITVER